MEPHDHGARIGGGLLAMDFDHVEWDERSDRQILDSIHQVGPVWLRMANFFERSLRILKALPPGQLVLWKLEHWGATTPFDRVPASSGVNAHSYATELFDLSHRVVPYTFTSEAREMLVRDVPALLSEEIAVIPVAQKKPVAGETRNEVRMRLGVRADDLLLGCGGLLHPAKGLDELAVNFLRSCGDRKIHLLCSAIPIPEDDGLTESVQRGRWERLAGRTDSSRLHICVSDYGHWSWMCSFYRAIDVMLVNSISDSWGRMVAEPLGFGVPTVVREAACATNHLAPDLVIVPGFDDFTDSGMWEAVSLAQHRSFKLADYVQGNFGLSTVRDQVLRLMRRRTPSGLLAKFDDLSRDPRSLAVLDSMIDH